MINPIKLRPFKKFCVTIGNLPTSYIESLSYYEMLEWLCNYIEKTVIPAINTEGEAISELQEAFTTLKTYVDTYFENLDVQEEINNKLDEMAESGELTELISAYLQLSSVLAFDNILAMKESENLISGSITKTCGFYEYNDGGGAFYRVRDITNVDVIDEITLIALHDVNLVAELINKECNIKQFGAKGDGETDDTEAINLAISKGKNITFPSGDYVVSESFDLETDNIIINGNNATIKPSHAGDCFNVNADNIEINNLNIDGGCNYGYDVNGNYCKINNCTISNTLHNAIMITGSHNVVDGVTAIDCGWDCVGNYGNASYNIIQNSNAIRCKRHGFSTDPTTRNISFINCYCENIGDPRLDEGHSCFHFEYSDNGTVRNCHAIYNGLHVANTLQGEVSRYVGVRIYHSDNVIIDNFRVEYTSDYTPLNGTCVINNDNSNNGKILNSTLINNSNSSNVGYIYISTPIEIYNTKMFNVYISEQDGYSGQIKVLKDCNIELTNKNNFANFKYLLENAIISGNKFKGFLTLDYFISARFVNCIIKDNIFDTGKQSLVFTRDALNNSNLSICNKIEDCTFKDCDYMFSYLFGKNANETDTNYMNRCLFTGTCSYVIVGNYNSFKMTNCSKNNLTVNNSYGYALYFDVFNDLKTLWDYTTKALNPSKVRYNITVNGSGQVIATQE